MISKISRRDLVKQTLMAATAAAALSCKTTDYKVNLICSGMILFFNHRRTGMLEILVPKPQMESSSRHQKTLVHKVRFGEIGGENLPGTMTTGSSTVYELNLPGIKQDRKNVRQHKKGEELAFPHQEGFSLHPNPDGIYCSILVPMPTAIATDPTCVRNLRPISPADGQVLYNLPSFASEQPDTVPGVVILGFDGVTGPVTMTDSRGWNMTFPVDKDGVNIHLYSEPPRVPCAGSESHLALFNNLFYRIDESNPGQPIGPDIKSIAMQSSETTIGDIKNWDHDLSLYDLATLAEIDILMGSFPTPDVCEKIYSPADCINGWAYGS